ncbi:hypothetical protein [Rhizobium leguminosarum]|uniref:hypothetical protein n=1 Tax=Rhizobium leguminosarum TaxID=384 RepID=UPI003F9D4C45
MSHSGIREERIHDLLEAGIIEQVEAQSDDERAYTRIRRSAVEELTHRLTENTTTVTRDSSDLSLANAARTWRRPFRTLVSMILEGSLERDVIPGDAPVFSRLRVSPRALVSPMSGGDDELMRLKEAELALGTTTITIAELLKRGYLRERTVRRETGRKVKFIERQSLIEFHAACVSLTEIAKSRKGYRAAIKRMPASCRSLNPKDSSPASIEGQTWPEPDTRSDEVLQSITKARSGGLFCVCLSKMPKSNPAECSDHFESAEKCPMISGDNFPKWTNQDRAIILGG